MNRVLLAPLAVVTLVAASSAHAFQCYTMFDAKNARVLQTATAPIDLSKSIGDQMAARYPGRFLEISDIGSCAEVDSAATRPAFNVLSNTGDADFAGTSPAVASAAPASDPAPVRRVARGRR